MGTRIWQLFTEHEVLADVAEDRCSADLLAPVADLERQGLVAVS